MKRFLSVLLTIAMLLSLVTISAVAEEEAPLVIDLVTLSTPPVPKKATWVTSWS